MRELIARARAPGPWLNQITTGSDPTEWAVGRWGRGEFEVTRILEMRDIVKSFSGVKALSGVTLGVEEGEIHAICGENGAGKSTLVKVLSGVHPHGTYEGMIVFEGEECTFRSLRDSEEKGIVIIHQELALSPYLSIGENIFLGNEQRRGPLIDWQATYQKAADLLKRVGLKESPRTRVMDIGVGKQQLVEIAKALAKRVKILILDEPTAALNDDDSEHLLALMRTLKAEGITQIIISHKLNEILEIADSVTIIRDGSVVAERSMAGEDPVTEDWMIRQMVGRPLGNRFPDHESHVGAEMLRVEDWTVHHPQDRERVIVDHASINVRAGEIVGIAGLMGAGRTEFAMSLFGHQYGRDISGKVFVNGVEVNTASVPRAKSAGLAYVSEDRKKYGLNLIGEVRHNVSAAALGKLVRHGMIDKREETSVAEGFRESMRIRTPTVSRPVATLSGGNQQKVAVSKWMYTDPEILILDEPTRGIDVGAKYEIYTIIHRLADEGKAVLVISSELPELLGICDRIYTLSAGRITGVESRGEATQESLMRLMTLERDNK